MFGPLAVEDGARVLGPRDLGGVKMRQLLEVLLAARGHPVTKERLADLLWGENAPRNVRGSLEHSVCILRQRLAGGGDADRLVATQSGAYLVRWEEADVDLDRFDALLERSEREAGRARRATLEEALALARGDVLEDEPHAPWAKALRETYRRRVADVRLDAAEAALAARDLRAALDHADAATAADPFSDRPQQIAMLAQYALGRQYQALETYGRFRDSLRTELGIEPMPATRDLHLAILQQVDVDSLLPPREPEPAARPRLAAVERPAPRGTGLPVVRIVERTGGKSLQRQMEPLAQALGARLGAARCSRRRGAVQALGAALADAVGRGAVRDDLGTLESVVDAIRRHTPLLLVVEDLDRAEEDSVGMLDAIRRECTDLPVVIVASYRPERVQAGHPLAAARTGGGVAVAEPADTRTWLLRVAVPLIAVSLPDAADAVRQLIEFLPDGLF